MKDLDCFLGSGESRPVDENGSNLGIRPLFKETVSGGNGRDPLGGGDVVYLRDYYKSSGRDMESLKSPRSSKNRKEETVVSTPVGLAVEWI